MLEPGPALIAGRNIDLVQMSAEHDADLQMLDWRRSLHPAMGGPVARLAAGGEGAYLLRERATNEIVGVLDARPLSGYDGVVNLSIFVDTTRARSGLALEAYGRLIVSLFERGARVLHHEVLALNTPVQRMLRGVGVAPSARFRDHAYAAGRFWDVIVFSYDRATAEHVLRRVFPRAGKELLQSASDPAEV